MPRQSFDPQGIIRDRQAWELADEPVWTDGKNIVFRTGPAIRASRGIEVFDANPAGGPPSYLQSSITADLNTWLYPTDVATVGGAQEIWATDGTTHKEITPTPAPIWTPNNNAFTQFNISGLPGFSWGAGSAYWGRDYGTPTPMVDMSTAPLCKSMRSHQNRLLAINTSDDPGVGGVPNTEETIRWSSLPDPVGTMPDVWLPAIDNSAGDAQLSGGGPLIDAATLRASLIVAGQDRLWIMDEVGGSFVYSVRKLSSTTGVLSRNCMAAAPMGMFILSGDDITILDGTSQRSIIDNQNKKWFFSQVGDNFQNCFVALYAARSEVWFCAPTGQSERCRVALVFDLGTQKWGQRDLPDIAAATSGPIPFGVTTPTTWDTQPVTAAGQWDSGNYNYNWNRAVNQSAIAGLVLAAPDPAPGRFISIDNLVAGTDAQMYDNNQLIKADMTLGDESRRKMVRRIWPRIQGGTPGQANQFRVSVGARDSLGNTFIDYGQSGRVDFNPSTPYNNQKVDLYASGRYISVRFDVFDDFAPSFEITGFDIEFEYAGQF